MFTPKNNLIVGVGILILFLFAYSLFGCAAQRDVEGPPAPPVAPQAATTTPDRKIVAVGESPSGTPILRAAEKEQLFKKLEEYFKKLEEYVAALAADNAALKSRVDELEARVQKALEQNIKDAEVVIRLIRELKVAALEKEYAEWVVKKIFDESRQQP